MVYTKARTNTQVHTLYVKVVVWVIAIYIWASILEWISHVWIMHGTGIFGPLFKRFGISDSHIHHHSETTMQQRIPPDFDKGEIGFGVPQMIMLYIVYTGGVLLLWMLVGLRIAKWYIPATVAFVVSMLIFWIWNSFHSAYHRVHVTPEGMPLQSFNPDKSSWLYKTWYKYHTLHHLNKGVRKGNFNVVAIPAADLLFGTFTPRVDNSKHFKTAKPTRPQEEWLSEHLVFDIQVTNDNGILYKEHESAEWKPIPDI